MPATQDRIISRSFSISTETGSTLESSQIIFSEFCRNFGWELKIIPAIFWNFRKYSIIVCVVCDVFCSFFILYFDVCGADVDFLNFFMEHSSFRHQSRERRRKVLGENFKSKKQQKVYFSGGCEEKYRRPVSFASTIFLLNFVVVFSGEWKFLSLLVLNLNWDFEVREAKGFKTTDSLQRFQFFLWILESNQICHFFFQESPINNL